MQWLIVPEKLILLLRKNIVPLSQGSSTHPFVADELLVADGLVGLQVRDGAVRAGAVAEALTAAAVVIAALVVSPELAVVGAAWTLK